MALLWPKGTERGLGGQGVRARMLQLSRSLHFVSLGAGGVENQR